MLQPQHMTMTCRSFFIPARHAAKKKRFDPSYSSVPKYLVLLTHLGLDLFQMGCYVDQICISVMMVINLKHLESSRAEALSLPCFKLTAQWGVLFSRECDDS